MTVQAQTRALAGQTDGPRPGVSQRRVLLGGLCTLIIAMGIGRFAYTPILPNMQAALGLSHEDAGLLASFNFLGYLIGALAGGYFTPGTGRTWGFRLALVLSVATTGLMAATGWFPLWSLFRLASGIISGLLFVFSADIVMRTLAQSGRMSLLGVHFGGVGIGIALSGLLVPPLELLGGWQANWAGLALLGIILAVMPWLWLRDDDGKATQKTTAADPAQATRIAATAVLPLAVLGFAYFLEGLGYVVSGTFLVTILQAQSANSPVGDLIGPAAWTVVGLAGAPSCLLWAWAGQRWGEVPALIAAHLLQTVGIALPLVSSAFVPALVAAVLFGGTFMGITVLVVAFARKLTPNAPAKAIGLMTACFGLGQILGPLIAGRLAERSGSFDSSLLLSALAVAIGAGLLAFLLKTSRELAQH